MIALPEDAQGALAVGWATVELDRGARELAHLLAVGSGFTTAASSVVLGARCRVGLAEGAAGLRIVLLEPETEGRLAARLARSGEGWAATWVAGMTTGDAAATADPGALSGPRPGPFGAERLVLDGAPPTRHRFVVDAVPSPL